MEFIGILCLLLVATTAAGHFSKRMGIPAVIGQLLVGILLGEGVLNWVHPSILVSEFSEIGVILLMFLAGVESDLSILKKYLRPSFLVASFGIIIPIILGFISGKFTGISNSNALFLGIILTATSVSISVEVLKELKVLDTKEGATIIGAAVIDDILSVLLVSFSISFLAGNQEQQMSLDAILLIAEQFVYFILIYFLVKKIAPFLMQLSTRLYTSSSVIIVSLIICLFMAYLADLVGLSSVIGAFFAGIAVGQTKVKKEVNHNIEALGYSTFIPVFFVSIGISVSFSSLGSQWVFIMLFVVAAVISKLIGCYFGAKISGFKSNSSLMVGAGMVSRGEMALIILQLGSQAGLVSAEYYSSIVIVILVTTILSPLILKFFTEKVYKTSLDG